MNDLREPSKINFCRAFGAVKSGQSRCVHSATSRHGRCEGTGSDQGEDHSAIRQQQPFGGALISRSVSLILAALAACTATPSQAHEIFDAVKTGNHGQLISLLEAAEDPNIEGPVGTPLHIASLRGDVESMQLLIASEADLNATSDWLGTPLIATLSGGSADGKRALRRGNAVSLLIEAGADVNISDAKGMTALHFAVVAGDEISVELLLNDGADPNAVAMPVATHISPDRTGLGNGPTSPLHLAIWGEHTQIVQHLIEAGATPTKVIQTWPGGDADRGLAKFNIYCAKCHSLRGYKADTRQAVKGPMLAGVIDREVASSFDYKYSDALKSFGGAWDADRLFTFSIEPKLLVPGTSMTGMNEVDPASAADIIAYLLANPG